MSLHLLSVVAEGYSARGHGRYLYINVFENIVGYFVCNMYMFISRSISKFRLLTCWPALYVFKV